MKFNKLTVKLSMLAVALFAITFTACKKEDTLGSPDRLFRPVINETSYGGTWIKAVWDKYSGVDKYQLQLSTDSFQTFVADVETDTTFFIFDSLEYDTNYYLRIKSIGQNLESRYFANDIIKTSDYPTLLNPITSSDVIDTQVKVSWQTANYDSLRVMKADTLVKTVALTDQQNSNKQLIIKGLKPETSYTVRAYIAGQYQGKKAFTTLASQVIVGDMVDLRDFSDSASYSMLSQEFFDSLAVTYPSGVTVILSGGTHYELGGTKLKAPLTLVTGYSLNGNAVIEDKGNFDAEAGAEIGNIRLEKLTIIDHPDDTKYSDSNYGGNYVMNISGSGAVVDTFSIENCDIRYKRGVLRIKTDATVKAVSINNCFIDSIAGYGIVNLDNSGVVCNSISVTNSTIAHCELFLRSDKMGQDLGNMTVSNVTTYDTPKSYLFRMGNISNVEISNCLFGAVWDPEGGAEGLRAGTVGTSTIKDNYRTSDCNWIKLTADDGSVSYKNPIESTQLSQTSAEIFGDVTANDYSVTDDKLDHKAGDPRWW
ncbi:MAG TPA: DUF4957 domain-containing protein [Sunxiuqinia sp.]|nr:DUF4957 domain-containing protein [Sunxiuqinia sp.]